MSKRPMAHPTQAIFSPPDRRARRGAAEVKKAWQTSALRQAQGTVSLSNRGSGTATPSLPRAPAAGAGEPRARSACRCREHTW